MEKRRINILCILLVLMFTAIVADVSYHALAGGFSSFLNKEKKDVASANLYHVNLNPLPFNTCPDTIRQSETGQVLPYRMDRISVSMKEAKINPFKILLLLMTPVLILFLLRTVFKFYNFISDVKGGKIFVRENIVRLRISGWTLLALGVLTNLYRLADYLEIEGLKVPGYQIQSFDVQYRVFTFALLMLLFAEIFALGVRMKEEQDLTV